MLTPRAAPNRVRLFFCCLRWRQGGQRSSEKQEQARTRMCRDACGAVGTWETCGVRGACGVRGVCESCAGVPLCCAKNGCDNAICWCKKRLPMQKLRTPLATDYKQTTAARCYQHLLPAPTDSGTSPARRTPCKISTPQYHRCYRRSISTPSTAALITQPIIPQPRRESLRTSFLLPLPIPVSANRSSMRWQVGRSFQRMPIRPRRRLPAPPRRLNARRTSPSSQHPPSLTNHRPDIPPHKNRSGRPLRIVPMLNNV